MSEALLRFWLIQGVGLQREGADNVMRRLRPPWLQLGVSTSRYVETCRILLGLGNTNRRATLIPGEEACGWLGKSHLRNPTAAQKYAILQSTQTGIWDELGRTWTVWNVLQLLARFSWVKEIEWRERKREMTKIMSKTRSQYSSSSRSSSLFNTRHAQ